MILIVNTTSDRTITSELTSALTKQGAEFEVMETSDKKIGFLDHKGKNIFDRILPLATMYLKFKGNQMRHVLRYKGRTDIGLIYRGEADREYLERWNSRATLNFGSKSLGAFPDSELKEAITCMH